MLASKQSLRAARPASRRTTTVVRAAQATGDKIRIGINGGRRPRGPPGAVIWLTACPGILAAAAAASAGPQAARAALRAVIQLLRGPRPRRGRSRAR